MLHSGYNFIAYKFGYIDALIVEITVLECLLLAFAFLIIFMKLFPFADRTNPDFMSCLRNKNVSQNVKVNI